MASGERIASETVHRIEFDVDFPPGHAATYLLDGDEPILFDAGTPGDDAGDELDEGLAAAGYDREDVAHVVLTHPHVDHIGQVDALREAGATVHAPRRFQERLSRDPETIREASHDNLQEIGLDDDWMDRILGRFGEAEAMIRDVLADDAVDRWFDIDSPTTVGGVELEGVHTPGHEATHVCFFTDVGDERVIFSGDMLIEPFRAATINVRFDDGVRDSIEDFRTALDRLAERSADHVYPGHGPAHDEYEAKIDRSRTQLAYRVNNSARHVREEGSTAFHVASNIADDGRHLSRILPEVTAALGSAEHEDQVTSTLEDGVRYYEPA